MTAPLPDSTTYVGTDRRGVARTGSLVSGTDLMSWVQQRYHAGWRALTVRRANDVVGEIGPSYGRGGRRIWWAER